MQSALTDLQNVQRRISALGLFSNNETVEDLNTRDIPYLLLPYAASEFTGRLMTDGREDKLRRVQSQIDATNDFLSRIDNYDGLVSEEEKVLVRANPSSETDPSRVRELKIKQYKKCKEIESRILVVCFSSSSDGMVNMLIL